MLHCIVGKIHVYRYKIHEDNRAMDEEWQMKPYCRCLTFLHNIVKY